MYRRLNAHVWRKHGATLCSGTEQQRSTAAEGMWRKLAQAGLATLVEIQLLDEPTNVYMMNRPQGS
jgi:alpha-D-ribose 1-methylphosphonate 5-triphosphate synthase subunit PhnL